MPRSYRAAAAVVVVLALSGCGSRSLPAQVGQRSPTAVQQTSPASSSLEPSPSPPSSPSPLGLSASPTQAAPATAGPSPRSGAAMAFNAATGKIVLFGGYQVVNSMGRQLSDTWTWDGARWAAEQPTPAPAARTDPAMAYDAARRAVVLHGGQGDNGFVNDTWTWNGARWVLMSPNETPPSMWGGRQPITWDGDRKVVLLFDWTGRWTAPGELNQTWAWNGSNWTQLPTAGAPSGHTGSPSAIAYDAVRKSTVFFGHVRGTPTTWTFDGTTWTQVSTSGSASVEFSLAADGARSVLVLFGQNGDTWTWNGTKWTPQTPAHSPSPRFGAAMTYDSVHHLVVLFGGSTDSSTQLNDTWTWNGSDWTKVVTP